MTSANAKNQEFAKDLHNFTVVHAAWMLKILCIYPCVKVFNAKSAKLTFLGVADVTLMGITHIQDKTLLSRSQVGPVSLLWVAMKY